MISARSGLGGTAELDAAEADIVIARGKCGPRPNSGRWASKIGWTLVGFSRDPPVPTNLRGGVPDRIDSDAVGLVITKEENWLAGAPMSDKGVVGTDLQRCP